MCSSSSYTFVTSVADVQFGGVKEGQTRQEPVRTCTHGLGKDKVTVTAWNFFLPGPSVHRQRALVAESCQSVSSDAAVAADAGGGEVVGVAVTAGGQ